MSSITEVEKLAFDLPDAERAILAVHLLGSLPPVLDDADGGIAEALRRDSELDADPGTGISLEELDDGKGFQYQIQPRQGRKNQRSSLAKRPSYAPAGAGLQRALGYTSV